MIQLLEFQQEDIDKLRCQPSVLIASEMGTGKTIEAIELVRLAIERQRYIHTRLDGPTLVVAPLSTHDDTWVRHFKLMTPHLKVFKIDPTNAKTRERIYTAEFDVAIVHWEALRLLPDLAKTKWLHIIADECHRMQNRNSQQTKTIKAIPTAFKTAMSGTPVTTSPEKWWSVLNWLDSKEHSSYWKHFGRYTKFEVSPEGYRRITGVRLENIPRLHKIIEPYYVRHLKKKPCCEHHPQGVQPFLPDKSYEVLKVDLSAEQRKIYDQMREDMIAWVGSNNDQPIAASIAVAKLVRLQQFAAAYVRVLPNGDVVLSEPSSKLDEVMRIIGDTDGQVVVFSQFRQLINLLNKRLSRKSISSVSITGDVPPSQRGRLINLFQAGERRVFTGTIAAGGVGITLTAASLAIFTDRSWSPALNEQAEDRLWRIGQKNSVLVLDIIARNTVDLGKRQRLEAMSQWLRQLLDPTAALQRRFLENPLDKL